MGPMPSPKFLIPEELVLTVTMLPDQHRLPSWVIASKFNISPEVRSRNTSRAHPNSRVGVRVQFLVGARLVAPTLAGNLVG